MVLRKEEQDVEISFPSPACLSMRTSGHLRMCRASLALLCCSVVSLPRLRSAYFDASPNLPHLSNLSGVFFDVLCCGLDEGKEASSSYPS